MTATFDFSGLSPDLILDAIETTSIRVESGLLALNSYENRVYQFIGDENRRYVVKFYRPQRWNRKQLLEEHAFALELQSHDIPLIAPLAFDDQTLLESQGFNFAIYPSVGGREFEVDNLDQLEWMGRFIGRIHQVSSSGVFAHRPELDIQSHLIEPQQMLKQSDLIPSHLHLPFFTILDQVIELTQNSYSPTASIRLHGDCHPGNILWRDGPSFVDLDDCRMGPAVQDLWMMLSGDRTQCLLQLDVMLEAYQEFCDFDKAELKLIEPLRAMRMIHYMAWLCRRWQDPAFPLAFPWFAEDKYWENQILALKEQFSALQEPALTLF